MLLRKNPVLRIILNPENLEIYDGYKESNTGIYERLSIEQIELKEEKSNWIANILFGIAVISDPPVPGGGNLKNPPQLIVKLEHKTIKIGLEGVDLNKVESLINDFN
jgi:hypothetical protein